MKINVATDKLQSNFCGNVEYANNNRFYWLSYYLKQLLEKNRLQYKRKTDTSRFFFQSFFQRDKSLFFILQRNSFFPIKKQKNNCSNQTKIVSWPKEWQSVPSFSRLNYQNQNSEKDHLTRLIEKMLVIESKKQIDSKKRRSTYKYSDFSIIQKFSNYPNKNLKV